MIGLVTCFWVKNYGSALQSYATQNILDQLNVENETINYSVSNEPFLRRLNIILHKLRYPSVRKAKYDKYIKMKCINLKNMKMVLRIECRRLIRL